MKTIALIAAVVLPLWNIPLILRIQQRRCSDDISLYWALGVWVCLVVMFPTAVTSQDVVYRTFSVINIILFTAVAVQVVRFRKKGSS